MGPPSRFGGWFVYACRKLDSYPSGGRAGRMLLRIATDPKVIAIDSPEPACEASLVAHAKRDRSAFEPLYRAYLGPIYGYCYQRLGDVAAAEDATQQVFIQALTRLHTCRDESFRSWLFSIARNLTIDLHRARRRDAPLEAGSEFASDGASPEDLAIHADMSARLHQALQGLSPEHRDVITLRFSGVTSHETAQILRSTDGAVRQMQHRALERLRELMGLAPDRKLVRDE